MAIKLPQRFVAVATDDGDEAPAFRRDVRGPEARDRAFRDPAGDVPRLVRPRAR
ncbi:hypothetical protein ACG5V6_18325 [Streptomyces chitinivorans]|uniref:Uncharacterized protein n=1 Tax=Streptomyces chitinivorans TaxID=1257027 RepID=A0ABW7HWK6_9ACTN|nr:hypothetical protein [Streptomyces chitinivorans]MDH2408470.1 hypothetical protein [Streptomyces chitinivorans]